jgi:hypothetical protein
MKEVFGKFRAFGSVASREVVVDGRMVNSYWDTCASHNFISTRLAAEMISRGCAYRRTELPILQGVIHAGVSRIMILLNVTVVHQGRILNLQDECFWIWDMGSELTFSNSLLHDEGLLPANPDSVDGEILRTFVTRGGPFEAGEGESLLLSHLQSRSNFARECVVAPSSINNVAQAGPPLPDDAVCERSHEELVKQYASSVTRKASRATGDAYSLERILEVRRTLLSQLKTPDAECFAQLQQIKVAHPEAFGEDISSPCKLKKFEIKLKSGFKYYAFLPRRVSEPVLEQMKAQIATLLEQGVIENCEDSPFAFPIVMARRNGSDKLRLCIDFKFQNDQTEPFPYPIPEIKDQLDRLAGNEFFCSLDCSSFFHEFEILESCRALTAFVTPWGQKLQWKRVPFGLRNAPAHCQRQFQELLANSHNPHLQNIIPYFDDCAFGAKSIPELCDKLEALLKIAVDNGLKFKESKCIFGTRAINHLGFVVNRDGVHISPDRVDKLLKISAAKNVDEVRHILGAFGFCRAWMADSASVSAPLTDLLRKATAWEWGPKQEAALDRLKAAVASSECLAGNINKEFPVYGRTDASILGVAAVLFQMFPSSDNDASGNPVLRPKAIAYGSRRFSPTESRWTLNVKEGYSLKFFFEKFGNLVQGYHVHLQTDHRNSLFMNNTICPKVMRWRLFMNRWSYDISHLKGVENSTADGLSRKLDECTEEELNDTLSRLHISQLDVPAPTDEQTRILRDDLSGLDEEQDDECDADLSAMFNSVVLSANLELDRRQYLSRNPNFNVIPSHPAIFNNFSSIAHLQHVAGGAATSDDADDPELPRPNDSDPEFEDRGEEEVALDADVRAVDVVSSGERFSLLQYLKLVHSDSAGHVGALKTYRRLRMLPEYPWDLSSREILDQAARFIAACPVCQKSSSLPAACPSIRWIRQPPFQEVAIDVLEMPFPDSDGNAKVLVAVDSFTRAIELFPLPTADAERVAECLYSVYCRYHRITVIRCDGAKAFAGSVVSQLLKILGSTLHVITPFAHWQNGQVERAHREILRHLRALVVAGTSHPRESRWGTFLCGARRILMNTVNASTGVTPNDLVYGGFADSEELLFKDSGPKASTADKADAFVSELQREQAEILVRAEEYQQRKFNLIISKTADVGDQALLTGDWVLCYRGGLPHGRPRTKLQFPWSGPWRVLDREPDPLNPRVRCLHAASRQVETFGRNELRAFNVDLMDSYEDFAKAAQRDNWDYHVEAILGHRPEGPRRLPGGSLRRKDSYQFLVKYSFLPLSVEPGSENPSWQPYHNIRFTEALANYCQRPEVLRHLRADFCPAHRGDE